MFNKLKIEFATIHPINWPTIKYGNDAGAIPVKVSVNIRAIVTAGLANEVDDVNQYPAVIKSATPIATES